MDRNKLLLMTHHLGVPSVLSKTILEPMVCLAQTVHLPCTNTNTVSKHTKTRFDMTDVTLEFHRVRPKWFLTLLYVQRKPCTHLVSRLALCPNRPRWASTWALSPSSTIGSVQNDYQPMVRLAQTVHLTCTEANAISKQTKTRFNTTHVT
jgi:hypothetical protein